MKQQTIEVEGLPEGWKAVAYRIPEISDHVLGDDGEIWLVQTEQECKQLVVEKTQPRRIVLEETEEIMTREKEGYVLTDGERIDYINSGISISPPHKIWREVKE